MGSTVPDARPIAVGAAGGVRTAGARPQPLPRRGRPRARRLFLHELRQILRLAGPIVLSQLGQVGMNTTDTLMVGPLGAAPLAAAGLGSAVHMFVLFVCMGIVLGTAPLISQAYGARDEARCRAVLVQGLWASIALSVPGIWVSLEGHRVALALGQESGVAALAGGYLFALAPGVPALLMFMAFRQYLEGMGRATPAMVLTFLGLGLNVAANYAFIHGVGDWIPPMGVVGCGWATTLVRFAMLGGMLAYVLSRPSLHPFRGARLALDVRLLGRITSVGAPISGQLGLEVGLFAFAAVMMGWLGPAELAAHQITINIASTTFMLGLGASLAGSIRVGHHVGAGRPRGARRAVLGTYLLAVGSMAACALVFVVAPRGLIGLYSSDPAILAMGGTLLLFAAAFQVFDGAQVAGLCALRGAGDTYVPMLLAAFGYWGVGLPAALALGFRTPLGPAGIWAGLSAALAVVAVLLLLRVRHTLWRHATAPLAPLLAGR